MKKMTMKISLLLVLVASMAEAFSPLSGCSTRSSTRVQISPRNNHASPGECFNDQPERSLQLHDRRTLLSTAVRTAAAVTTSGILLAAATTTTTPAVAWAADMKRVVVAGATGQTGRRILERLAAQKSLQVVAGVRNPDRARKSLSESSTVVRGAMVQQVGAVDTTTVEFQHLDVVNDSVDALAEAMRGADALVIAIGFIPSNPFKMVDEAHKVDNLGTCALVDAAKKSGTIQKVVMVSSILTNARGWGQEQSPGFVVTNAFGNVLDEKIVAERYLRKSGLDYTIVRPGGLKAKPPTGGLFVSGEDTLIAGEISRDLVADVCVAALTDKKVSNKVIEIVEAEDGGPKVFNGLNM
jgi:uncharacterized protein YbjT (DUF2867 family)